MNKRTLMTIFLAVVLTVATIAGVWRARAQGGDSVGLPMLPAANPYSPTSSEQETAALYQQVTPSLVNITVATRDGSQGTGSGFVIDTEGHIVTNNHVVEDAFYIE
ncbi:MAG: hypothetical protein HY866_12135, partial [Chloroflexi bacterium]|nr:hypothetical protein [Chloroflexota bacterium]